MSAANLCLMSLWSMDYTVPCFSSYNSQFYEKQTKIPVFLRSSSRRCAAWKLQVTPQLRQISFLVWWIASN